MDITILSNKGAHSVHLMRWMPAPEVLCIRGSISRDSPWEVMPDLYFYEGSEDIDKERQDAEEKVTKEEF